MKRSEYLQNQISELRAVLTEMENSALWSYFNREFVNPLEQRSFLTWLKVPAENTRAIIEMQACGKLAYEIANWPKKLSQDLNGYLIQLKAIEEEETEDEDMET